ncbi:MAG: guanylate kinase [Candidatus Omnitrophota bacterium]|nr:guanylate kinase [Candidatus Omnitrophota bacterium]
MFVISSPSGGGKTTVAQRLRRWAPGLVRSVSVTTRPPRFGERDGRDYRFVTPRQFERMKRSGQLLEWARVHGASYGTPKRPIMQAIAHGRDALLSIDVQGARQVRRLLGSNAVLIFLLPPSTEALQQRLMRRRTDSASAIRRRMAAAAREMACAQWYDYEVVNDRLSDTMAQVKAIVIAAGAGSPRSRKGNGGP